MWCVYVDDCGGAAGHGLHGMDASVESTVRLGKIFVFISLALQCMHAHATDEVKKKRENNNLGPE